MVGSYVIEGPVGSPSIDPPSPVSVRSSPVMERAPGRLVVARVAVTTAAGLLFVVQPLAGRLVLPAFGGGPGTWAATLAFFQLALLVGYGYAHLALRRLQPRPSALVHGALAAAAVAVAAVAPPQPGALLPAGLEPAIGVVIVHAATIGPAVVLLAATTPLLTGWLALGADRPGTTAEQATDGPPLGSPPLRSPGSPGATAQLHRLYAFSNAGAIAALLLYPTVVEPNLGLGETRRLWLAGLAAFAVLIAAIGAEQAARADPNRPRPGIGSPTLDGRALRRIGRWLLLAAIPAGLLNTLTTILTLDLGAVPLLWILPLATYLGTFVLAFSPLADPLRAPAARLAPIAATFLWLPVAAAAPWSVLPLLAVVLGGLFVVALALHTQLAAARPAETELSGFYLAVAGGGALGGSFAGIVAPLLFPDLWELPILLVGAVLLGGWPTAGWPGETLGSSAPSKPRRRDPGADLDAIEATPPRPAFLGSAIWRLNRYVVVGVVVLVLLVADAAPAADPAILWFLGGAVALAVGARPILFAAATAAFLVVAVTATPQPSLFSGRSFFGILEVRPSADRSVVELWNGTTLHGTQPIDPARRLRPTGYYVEAGPAGDLVRALRTAAGSDGLDVGVVGLGVGGLAAYAEPDDRWTFVEVDPLVVRIATDPALFTYVSAAKGAVEIVVDDGRLALARMADGRFDLLVLDAFTSDAIPAHLVTAEAIADALRTVRPGGLLAAQLSNRYYDLVPAVAGAAELAGARVLVRDHRPTAAEVATGAFPSRWLVAGRSGPALDALAAAGWTPVEAAPPLTDDRPNLLRFLRWSFH